MASLKKLVENETLRGTEAESVANIVIEDGADNLSETEKGIFHDEILNRFFKMTCSNCGCNIQPEYWESCVEDNSKICPDCLQNQRKRDN